MSAQTPPHIVTLAMAAAISPLTMNVFLPSLGDITAYYQTDTATAQLSVSLFLAATAVTQLIFGPLSDKYGRRPVMLTLLTFMLAATLLCIFAPTIEVFLFARILQASAAVGIVLSRAIVRDIVEGDHAASMIGYVTMGMTLAPMLGPMAGGLLAEEYGWRASFWLIFGFTLLVMALIWFDLGETNKNVGGSMAATYQAWPHIISSHRFWGYAACCGFSSGAFFAFLGAAPIIATVYYDLSPTEIGLYFFFIAIGYMFGNFLAGRFSLVIGLNRMMVGGNCIVLVGLFAVLVASVMTDHNPLAFFGPIFLLGVGNGITLPNANAGIVNVRPENAGAASGLGGSIQIGGGAAFAAVAGYGLSPEKGPAVLIWVMMASIILAIVSAIYVIHIERKRDLENAEH